MILDLRQIKRSGKDNQNYYFEYCPENFETDFPNVEIKLPIKVEGSVTLTGEHSAYLEGEVNFTLKGECTRCLSKTERSFISTFSEDVSEDNENGYAVNKDTIDLAKIVEDAIYSEMPISFLCSENCKGICLGCGVNLNEGKCQCKK